MSSINKKITVLLVAVFLAGGSLGGWLAPYVQEHAIQAACILASVIVGCVYFFLSQAIVIPTVGPLSHKTAEDDLCESESEAMLYDFLPEHDLKE